MVKSKYFGMRDYNTHEDGEMDARDIDGKCKRTEDANRERANVEVPGKCARE